MVVGVSEDIVQANVYANFISSTGTVRQCRVGVGLDSTTVNSADIFSFGSGNSAIIGTPTALYGSTIPVGRHNLVWLEVGAGGDTQTWLGDNGGLIQSGISGIIWA